MIEIILNYAMDKHVSSSSTVLKDAFFDTNEIEKLMNISRTQASKVLNDLVEKEKLIKINTRPVLFAAKEPFNAKYNIELKKSYKSLDELSRIIESIPSEMVFEKVIGYDKSLSEAIEQLKTAIFYPNNGLPVMITGDTGVGKSHLVHVMHEYMIKAKVLNDKAPFKILNCAQYYNNPELLSTILFGHVRGAYTGAHQDQKGLLEEADGGLLFLDEVHRLNSEGQEKLFTFMDKGIFSRIGETNLRHVSLRIVFATTEKMNTFLQTFIRRIPIHIHIPNIEERSVLEKKQIVEHLLINESKIISRPIEVTPRFMNILLQHKYAGNIGEIENIIKYACGSALSKTKESGRVLITLRNFPQSMYKGIYNENDFLGEDSNLVYFSDKKQPVVMSNEMKRLQSLMKRINYIFEKYSKGIDDIYITKNQLDKLIVSFMHELIYNNKQNHKVAIEEFIIGTMQEIFRELDNYFQIKYDGNLVAALSAYIYKYLLMSPYYEQEEVNPELREFIERNYRNEQNKLNRFINIIQKRLDIEFSLRDICIFSLYLSTYKEEASTNRLNAIIIAHGYATASSIANVCNRMLGENVYSSIDMPIEATIHDISEKLELFITENNISQGLIVLIDMGSLNMLYEKFKGIVDVPLLFVDHLGTLTALEIGNLIIQRRELIDIANQMDDVISPNVQLYEPEIKKKKLIITTCFTGLGTATQIQKLLYECLDGIIELDIMPFEYQALKDNGLEEAILKKYDLISIIGTDNPRIKGVNFVYLENIISGDGENQINEAFKSLLTEAEIKEINNRLVKKFSLITVIDSLTILDTQRILEVIEEIIMNLENKLDIDLTNARKVSLYVHVSCMVERLIRKSDIEDYPDLEVFSFEHQREIKIIQEAFSVLESKYSVRMTLPEIGYIYNILYVE